MLILIQAIRALSFLLILAVLVDIILGYFMDPYHPVRRTLDSIVQPMLAPIRRVLPTLGGFDFSPLVLIILIDLIESILVQLLLILT
ncbi:MAG TPA: YggT family protein [Anaerolineae bacterium]|nr:YggT family protein [Anaerolineae bacterium]